MHNWFVYDTFEAASKAAADYMATTIEHCLGEKKECHIILPGGQSPSLCLNTLAEKKLDWENIHWYLGDERCYPKNHPERNDVMLHKNLWSKIGAINIHSIPTELGAEKAAEIYREIIKPVVHFDIAFLGMGEDGHTASLFPGNAALSDLRSVVPVNHSPKPPAERVTLSVDTFKRADCRIVLTGGAAKSKIINRIKEGDNLPVNCIGDINWFVDTAAILLNN